MDELLEGAATELLRSRGMLPEEGGDNSQGAEKPGGDAVSEKPGGHEGEGGGDGKGEEGAMGGGAERSPAEEEAERYKEILRELTEFRRVFVFLNLRFVDGQLSYSFFFKVSGDFCETRNIVV